MPSNEMFKNDMELLKSQTMKILLVQIPLSNVY